MATLFLFAMAALLMNTIKSQDAIYDLTQKRLRVYLLVSELARNVDNSVVLARAYISTGNPWYRQRYFENLARQGIAAQSLFAPAAPTKQPTPRLEALMRGGNFTDEEIRLVDEMKKDANALAASAKHAFAVMEGLSADRQGNFTVRSLRDPEVASRLLHSDRYLSLYDDATVRLARFDMLEGDHMKSEMRASIASQEDRMFLMVGLIATGFLCLLVVVRYSRKKILGPLEELVFQTTEIGRGNYAARCEIRVNNEIAQLGTSFNVMAAEIERDIAERKVSEEKIWRQANFDSLTGLPNRHMLVDRVKLHTGRTDRAGRAMALAFIDLDHFKEVNDTLGHGAGDMLLSEAAQRLTACVRSTDTVARFAGDEFIIVLDDLDSPTRAERVAQEILQKMALPFQLAGKEAYITASIGIAIYPQDGNTPEALLTNADQAMYSAKQQGRNRYAYFTASMQEEILDRLRIAQELRVALAENQLRLEYQPIVDLASGTISKAEALIRWDHPQRGPISPARFIPIAEQTGMIVEIGDWVFREAAQQVARWRASGRDVQVSVNTSPAQYRNNGVDQVAWLDYLDSIGLPGNSMAIEITEGLLMEAGAAIADQLQSLRRAGVQISLDDFGTGYSSLSYLRKFHVDYLKIDQSFVRNLTRDSDEHILCQAMIEMAHRLGLKVVAEGVETAEHHALLIEIGCDYGQGYFLARPMPPEQFNALLPQPSRQIAVPLSARTDGPASGRVLFFKPGQTPGKPFHA